jgi:hypothetical protein
MANRDGVQADGDGVDLKSVAASVTAVVGVFAALAATGVIGEAQRNHGLMLVIALGLVLVAAVAWLFGALVPAGHAVAVRTARALAAVVVAVGLILGILAIWFTQKDSERPSVSSTYDPGTHLISVTANAHGLRSDSRLVVQVSGFRGTPDDPRPDQDPPTLYYAVVGPNGDGDVTQTASIPVPAKYTLVGVKAWTGKEPNACTTVEVESATTKTPSHDRVGCLLLQVR